MKLPPKWNVAYPGYKCYYWLVRVDAGGHSGLPALVLGSAYVSSKVDGLQVINGHDALGDAGGVSHSSVDQPPRITHTNRTKVLARIGPCEGDVHLWLSQDRAGDVDVVSSPGRGKGRFNGNVWWATGHLHVKQLVLCGDLWDGLGHSLTVKHSLVLWTGLLEDEALGWVVGDQCPVHFHLLWGDLSVQGHLGQRTGHTTWDNSSPVRTQVDNLKVDGGGDEEIILVWEVDITPGGAVGVFETLRSVTQCDPAAVHPCVGSRGRRQDKLAVLITLLDAESGVIEGVQVDRVGPADVTAFTTQLYVVTRAEAHALSQPQETALIQDLGQDGLPSSSCLLLLQFGVANLGPLASRPDAVLTGLLPTIDLLAGTILELQPEHGQS